MKINLKINRRFELNEVLDFVTEDYTTKEYENYLINMNSERYKLFKEKGVSCVEPGCINTGTHFKLDFNGNQKPHFNLYTDNGILMTKDHIIPKSYGGTNNKANYQVMCTKCNGKKGNGYTKEDALLGKVKNNVNFNMNGEKNNQLLLQSKTNVEVEGFTLKKIELITKDIVKKAKSINEYGKMNKVNAYEVIPKELKEDIEEVLFAYNSLILFTKGNITIGHNSLKVLPKKIKSKMIYDTRLLFEGVS